MSLFNKVKKWFSANDHRKENLKVVAEQLNMTYTEKDEFGMINLLKDFKLFRKGFNKRITNILQQKDEFLETDIQIFDYKYARRYGKRTKTYSKRFSLSKASPLICRSFIWSQNIFFIE